MLFLWVGLNISALYADETIHTPLGNIRSSFKIISYVGYEMAQIHLTRPDDRPDIIEWQLSRKQYHSEDSAPEYNYVSDELMRYISRELKCWEDKPGWLKTENILPAMMLLAYEEGMPLPDANLYITSLDKGRGLKLFFQGLEINNFPANGYICILPPGSFKRKHGEVILQCSSKPQSLGTYFIKYCTSPKE